MQHRIARPVNGANMGENDARHVSAFDASIEYDGLFAILSKESDGDPLHESVLGAQGHATNFLGWGQVTIVIEKPQAKWQVGCRFLGASFLALQEPSWLLVFIIVRQKLRSWK